MQRRVAGDLETFIQATGEETTAEIKKCTKAGSRCGGCEPDVKKILKAVEKMGATVNNNLCAPSTTRGQARS